MKFILILLLISNICYSQSKYDSVLYKSGNELIKFEKIHRTGTTLEIIGVVTAGVSLALTSGNNGYNNVGIIAIGGGISLVGYLITLTSYNHIKLAGIEFKNSGVIIPIKHKKAHWKIE